MLELQIVVLNNLSHDKKLFRKELIKSKQWLSGKELEQLKKWLLQQHYDNHKETINEVMSEVIYYN